ncbi:MAG: FecR family protein [Pseudomonas sp.]|uniref:FecR family protein n=1 Tax=Pseudomonas sp. TaxID=306 RepID=UPI003D0975ED
MISQERRDQEIRQEAAQWAVRLSAGAMGAEQREELQRWLGADERHAQELAFAQNTWKALGKLGSMPAQRGHATTSSPRQHARRPRRIARWAASAAAVLLVALMLGGEPQQLWLPLVADHATARGEILKVPLPDGSLVELNTRSAIDIVYSDTERRVRLLSGEAYFTVAPMGRDEKRPFVVDSAGGTTTALGTQFLVGRTDSRQAWVGVLEHSVAVTLDNLPTSGVRTRTLHEGHSARYTPESGVQPIANLDLRRADSWRRGVLVFERAPLGQVAEQLGRYRSTRILITDTALAKREVSGVFRLDMLDDAVATLAREMRAERLDLPGLTVLY